MTSGDLDRIILDDHIGEQLLAGEAEPLARRLGVGRVDLDVEHLALANAFDAGDAERFQRALDPLALRIEDAALQRDDHARFHGPVPLHTPPTSASASAA